MEPTQVDNGGLDEGRSSSLSSKYKSMGTSIISASLVDLNSVGAVNAVEEAMVSTRKEEVGAPSPRRKRSDRRWAAASLEDGEACPLPTLPPKSKSLREKDKCGSRMPPKSRSLGDKKLKAAHKAFVESKQALRRSASLETQSAFEIVAAENNADNKKERRTCLSKSVHHKTKVQEGSSAKMAAFRRSTSVDHASIANCLKTFGRKDGSSSENKNKTSDVGSALLAVVSAQDFHSATNKKNPSSVSKPQNVRRAKSHDGTDEKKIALPNRTKSVDSGKELLRIMTGEEADGGSDKKSSPKSKSRMPRAKSRNSLSKAPDQKSSAVRRVKSIPTLKDLNKDAPEKAEASRRSRRQVSMNNSTATTLTTSSAESASSAPKQRRSRRRSSISFEQNGLDTSLSTRRSSRRNKNKDELSASEVTHGTRRSSSRRSLDLSEPAHSTREDLSTKKDGMSASEVVSSTRRSSSRRSLDMSETAHSAREDLSMKKNGMSASEVVHSTRRSSSRRPIDMSSETAHSAREDLSTKKDGMSSSEVVHSTRRSSSRRVTKTTRGISSSEHSSRGSALGEPSPTGVESLLDISKSSTRSKKPSTPKDTSTLDLSSAARSSGTVVRRATRGRGRSTPSSSVSGFQLRQVLQVKPSMPNDLDGAASGDDADEIMDAMSQQPEPEANEEKETATASKLDLLEQRSKRSIPYDLEQRSKQTSAKPQRDTLALLSALGHGSLSAASFNDDDEPDMLAKMNHMKESLPASSFGMDTSHNSLPDLQGSLSESMSSLDLNKSFNSHVVLPMVGDATRKPAGRSGRRTSMPLVQSNGSLLDSAQPHNPFDFSRRRCDLDSDSEDEISLGDLMDFSAPAWI